MRDKRDHPLDQVRSWPAANAAVAVVDASGQVLDAIGDTTRILPLASVTKAVFAFAVLVAVEEETLSFDEPAGLPGSTIAHLLSHSSGFSDGVGGARPGTRRIYANRNFDELGVRLTERSGMAAADYVHEAVFAPLGMHSSSLDGSPAHAGRASVADLCSFVGELFQPTLIAAQTLRRATSPFLPKIAGVLPGFGRQDPNPWGYGFEIRGEKSPHWTGRHNSPETFGHFGRSGTFIWVDRTAGLPTVALTDEEFGPWAARAWPALSDEVLTAYRN